MLGVFSLPENKIAYLSPQLQGLFPNKGLCSKGRVTQLFGQKSYLETAPGA
jgi:hypothetical protein